uniref:Uncharacterized protein n=1 Tax=Anguilla anguilla TaxID=7936 RepID=A0A0E9W4L8_ANGAN
MKGARSVREKQKVATLAS